MQLQAGLFLKSTAALNNTVFENAMIFLTEYNTKGAMGFVINQPFGRSLHELEEFKSCPHFPLYYGGPVDEEHLFFVHQRPDLIEAGISVDHGIYMGGDFSQAVRGINNQQLTAAAIKIFVGYCGWDAGELEAEIEEGSWELLDTSVIALVSIFDR
jgi:putative transcriptional regulator